MYCRKVSQGIARCVTFASEVSTRSFAHSASTCTTCTPGGNAQAPAMRRFPMSYTVTVYVYCSACTQVACAVPGVPEVLVVPVQSDGADEPAGNRQAGDARALRTFPRVSAQLESDSSRLYSNQEQSAHRGGREGGEKNCYSKNTLKSIEIFEIKFSKN